MIITKIEPQKKQKNRSSVFLDGAFAFGISDFDLHRLQLKVGKTLSENELGMIENEILAQEAKQYALRLLDRHAYTEKGLKRKLTERGYNEQAIDYTIGFLKEYGYINDLEYARRYMETALCTGKSGMRKIKYDLAAKGIAQAILEELEQELLPTALDAEQDVLLALLEKKLKGDYSFPNIMKAKRYCVGRGFSFESVDNAIRHLKEFET